MSVALFTDFDDVLTKEPVNMQLARLLGVADRLAPLEDDYRVGRITNDQFNQVFIPLMHDAGFSAEFVEQHFDDVKLRQGARELLTGAYESYIVTSGPSYYLDLLRERYGIPSSRICCSRYDFDGNGRLVVIEPASAMTKADFVGARVRDIDIPVGVGDTVELDGPFMGHCRIRVLMGQYRPDYVSVQELAPVTALLKALHSAQPAQPRRRPTRRPLVFLGSSSEGKRVAELIQLGLDPVADTIVWDQGVFGLSRPTTTELWRIAGDVDYAVLVATADDAAVQRDRDAMLPRDNVLFELGLFAGRLGVENTFVVTCADEPAKLPTDLAGLTVAPYHRREGKDTQAALGPVVTRLKEAMGL